MDGQMNGWMDGWMFKLTFSMKPLLNAKKRVEKARERNIKINKSHIKKIIFQQEIHNKTKKTNF